MKISYQLVSILFWSCIIFLTGLLSFNALHYYTFSPEYGILAEKQEAFTNWIWTVSLYTHVGAGVVCLVIPLVLFIGLYFKLSKQWHKGLGKLYIIIVLLIVVPTGMYLAFFAKGGVITQVGFLVQGALLALSTYLAFIKVKQGNVLAHKYWMVHSYAAASAVLTFRALHILFYYLEIPYEINYALSQWLGLLINAFVAEFAIINQNSFKSIRSLKQLTT